MSTSNIPNSGQTKKAKILPSWVAYPLALIVWTGLPWAISFLTSHYGWMAGRPGTWNLLGLIPVVIGTIGMVWGLAQHAAQSPRGIEWDLDRSYLLMRGPYAFSRHPMYLSELILILGWVIFYGSISVLVTAVIAFLFFNYYAMPLEERVMEMHFGEAYREYKSKVLRWFGRIPG